MNPVRDCTLVFLIRREGVEIKDICLAMKKRGFGAGRWNGTGGKVEKGETIEAAAIREAKEEIGVDLREISKIGELLFSFSHNPAWDMLVHAYFCESWNGELTESEEMRPQWFLVPEIPFATMWPDDPFWLPHALAGKRVKARFVFGENDVIHKNHVQLVDNFSV
jgi:8-oxo-dGTP pyrophosphatase MutT (NUDIX family)